MFEYNLKSPIVINDKNYVKLVLNSPKIIHMPLIAPIREGYNQAQLDMMQRLKQSNLLRDIDVNEKESSSDEQNSDEIFEAVKTVLNNGCVGTNVIYDNMKALLLSTGIAKLEGETLQRGYLDRFSIEDFTELTAHYLANFIIPRSV